MPGLDDWAVLAATFDPAPGHGRANVRKQRKPWGNDNEQITHEIVAPPPRQGDRHAGGRHRGSGFPARAFGAGRLSRSPGQVRGRQYAGRSLRHHRPHRRGRAAANRPARHLSSRTSAGPAAISAWATRHAPSRTATRILLATNAYSVNSGLYNKLPYDPYKDFVGVCELASSPQYVRGAAPICRRKTIQEFVALAKANPDKFNVATPPIGTTPQIQAELLKLREHMPKLETVVLQGRRRRAAGAAQRHRAALLRLVAAGASAHQGRHAALPRGYRRPRAGPICRTSRPWNRLATRISCSRPIPCCWHPPRRRRRS